MLVEKSAAMNNMSKIPFTELLSDEEVKKEMELQISEQFQNYRIIEWNAHDEPMSFGRRIITCKFRKR